MKPVDVNSGNYVDFNKENDKKHPKHPQDIKTFLQKFTV